MHGTVRNFLLVASLWIMSCVGARAQVYISEFVADNQIGAKVDEDGDHSDWLEIWNSGATSVSLNGWYLTDTAGDPRKWRFPVTTPAVTLAAKARLVVFCSAKDRKLNAAFLHTNFKLSKNAGSYLALVQSDGLTISHAYPSYPRQVQDVAYGLPAQTTTQTLVAAGATGKVKVPLSAADMPVGASPAGWNTMGFDDSGWTTGATGFGYDTANTYGSLIGPGGDLQATMYNVNSTALIRIPFNVSTPSSITALKLSMKYDDGFLCYLNGTLIFSSLATTPASWNSSALADRSGLSNASFQVFNSSSAPSLLVAGTNVLSFQMQNNSNGSTQDVDDQGTPNGSRALCLPVLDATVDAGVGAPTYLLSATPGAANSAAITIFGPLITQATDTAPRPSGTSTSAPIVVSAKVVPSLNPLNAVNPVQLKYRLMQGSEQSVVMKDDGVAPDAVAGDSVYTAQFPTTNAGPEKMIRWRIEAKDSLGAAHAEPPFLDTTDNDQYYGTVTQDGITTSSLPILYWFVNDANGSRTTGGTRCSLFYLGQFYDNVYVNLHGQSSSGFTVNKKSENFNFSEDNRFQWKVGENRQRAVNLITTWADKSHVRDTLAWETWQNARHLASHWAQLVRVEQNGTFFGIYDMVENGDFDFVERCGLDGNGALYKMYNDLSSVSGNEKKTRDGDLTTTDLQALIDALGATWTSGTLPARRLYSYDNVDIPSLINYLAVNLIITNNDFGHKNYYLYRDTNGTREWSVLPWDEDLTFGHTWTSVQTYFNDDIDSQKPLVLGAAPNNRLMNLVMKSTGVDSSLAPEMVQMLLRRLRTLMDGMLVSATATDGPFEQRINQMLDAMDPPGALFNTDADLDLQFWGYWLDGGGSAIAAPGADAATHPHGVRKSAGRILNSNPAGTYPASPANAEGLGDTTAAYLKGRRTKLYNGGQTLNGQPIPAVQPSIPTGLVIEYVDANPGDQSQEFFIIRNNSTSYVDISGWKITGAVDFTFRGGTVIPPFTSGSAVNATGDVHAGRLHVARSPQGFRARTVSPKGREFRLVTGPYSGQLSARGETINLVKPGATPVEDVIVATLTYAANPTASQQFVKVSGIVSAPADPTPDELAALPGVQAGDFEYIELVNSGPNAINLGGASFDKGITFTFPANFTLQPNQHCAVAALSAAYNLRYGASGATLAGQFDGHLDNAGEAIELLDPVGEVVFDFKYDPSTPPTVNTQPVVAITRTSATLQGFATSNNASTSVFFERSDRPGADQWIAGTPPTLGPSASSPFTAELSNLTPHTVYGIRAVGQNSAGTTLAPSVTFATLDAPPVAVDDRVHFTTGNDIVFDPRQNDSDLDGDVLTISSVRDGAHGTVTTDGKTVHYLGNAAFDGNDSFTYTVDDGFGQTATGSVTLFNNPPTAADLTLHALPDAAGKIQIDVATLVHDADGDALSLTSASGAVHGEISRFEKTITYIPNPDFTGNDSITYTISDGAGGSASGRIVLVNAAPEARADSFVIGPGTARLDVLANDSDTDGDTLEITAVTPGANGGTSADGRVVTYTPAEGFDGSDAFTYTVTDGRGTTSTARVTLIANYAVERDLAKGGDPIPGMDGATWEKMGIPSLFAGGLQAGWRATYRVGGTVREGIFSGALGSPHLLAGSGSKVVNAKGEEIKGVTFRHFQEPVFADNYCATIATVAGPGVIAATAQGVWIVQSGKQREVARANALAPGAPASRFQSFNSIAMPAPGTLFFRAKLHLKNDELANEGTWTFVQGIPFYRAKLRPEAERVHVENDEGLWSWTEERGTKLVLREGQVLDSGRGARKLRSFRVLAPVTGSGGHGRYDQARKELDALLLFSDGTSAVALIGADGGLKIVKMTHDADADGRVALELGMPSSFGDGHLPVVRATIWDKNSGKSPSRAILDCETAVPLVAEGNAALGIPGATFHSFENPVAGLGAGGEKIVAFQAAVNGAARGENIGLWAMNISSQDPHLELIARQGEEPPGMAGAKFAGFESLSVLEGRGPVFVGRVSSVANPMSGRGCWAVTSSGDLQLLFAEGSEINGRILKKFSLLTVVPGSHGQRRSWTAGDATPSLIYHAEWADGNDGIITVAVP